LSKRLPQEPIYSKACSHDLRLRGVQLAISDDHAGLKRAIREFCRKPSGSAAMNLFDEVQRAHPPAA
jgi:transposase-like protein